MGVYQQMINRANFNFMFKLAQIIKLNFSYQPTRLSVSKNIEYIKR